jgi:hypothetical protein
MICRNARQSLVLIVKWTQSAEGAGPTASEIVRVLGSKDAEAATSGTSAHQRYQRGEEWLQSGEGCGGISRIRVRASGSLVAVASYREFWPSLLMASCRW